MIYNHLLISHSKLSEHVGFVKLGWRLKGKQQQLFPQGSPIPIFPSKQNPFQLNQKEIFKPVTGNVNSPASNFFLS